jgi:hypothetical protein
LALTLLACDDAGTFLAGPVRVSDEPMVVTFLGPVPVSGPRRELCFEFETPGESRKAGALLAVLITEEERRDTLHTPRIDRRGEARVCLVPVPPASRDELQRLKGTRYRAVELSTAGAPVGVRQLRWWSGT